MSDFDVSEAVAHRPNEPVEIFAGRCLVEHDGHDLIGDGQITYRWTPNARLKIDAKLDGKSAFGFVINGEGSQFRFDDFWGGTSIPGHHLSGTTNLSGHADIHAIAGSFEAGDCSDMSVLELWVVNGPRGRSGKFPDTGRSTLAADGWVVVVEHLEARRPQEIKRLVGREGGFQVSHACRVMRDDGTTFSRESVDDLLTCLFQFFAFCAGGWASLMRFRAIGSDGSMQGVFHREFRASRIPRHPTWLNDQSSAPLEELFPGFYTRWNAADWKQTLELAVYWHVAANYFEGGIEGALVLAHSAIESLSWRACVESAGLVSTAGFDKLSASDKIRLLLRHAQVDVAIPPHLTSLQAIAKADANVNDGPDAITYVRNCYVHPSPKNEAKLSQLAGNYKNDAWALGTLYLELAVLWACNFNGFYSDRSLAGTSGQSKAQKVPWSN